MTGVCLVKWCCVRILTSKLSVRPINEYRIETWKRIKAGNHRQELPYPPEMLEAIKQARREKVANKTKELQREARGEVLRRTVLRSRKGPPAHVLATMTSRQKYLDKISRSNVSEVGYVGMVKRKLGWKLRDPEAWKVENGKEEHRKELDAMSAEIRKENDRKTKDADPTHANES